LRAPIHLALSVPLSRIFFNIQRVAVDIAKLPELLGAPMTHPPAHATSRPYPQTDTRRHRTTNNAEHNNPTDAQTIPGR